MSNHCKFVIKDTNLVRMLQAQDYRYQDDMCIYELNNNAYSMH